LSRIYDPDSAGKQRIRLSKEVVLALRELMKQSSPDEISRDLAAFVAIALFQIHQTVEQSVAAWEKRGYWLKADRFRLDWEWSALLGERMRIAILNDDWTAVASTSVQIGQKLMAVKITEHHRLGKPWVGAWKQLAKT
jgi:hypothetical protein